MREQSQKLANQQNRRSMNNCHLSTTERIAWLRLSRTTTIGPVAFSELLRRYKTASAALAALPEIANRAGKTTKMKIPEAHQIEAEISALDAMGGQFLCACEDDYPKLLKALDVPPPVISTLGKTSLGVEKCVAVIGSRNASAIGLRFARQIASELAEAGYVIVSGLARGIDAIAHQAALEHGTIAVLGGGVDHVYPRQNAELYQDILHKGLLISESPLGYRAQARDFPRRNRIISGLSLGVVVIEAAERSGTLITARMAAEQNREVMAAPGSPLDPRTKGCNRLIRDGAALIESANDVIDVLNMQSSFNFEESDDIYTQEDIDWESLQDEVERAKSIILPLCSPSPIIRDELIRQSGIAVPIANAALLELEIAGDVFVEADGRVSLAL